MNKVTIHLLLVLALAQSLHGQVQELWRAGITNVPYQADSPDFWVPGTNFNALVSTVDAAGNTLVAGRAVPDYFQDSRWLLAKFSADGRLLWQYSEPGGAYVEVDDIAVNDAGEIILAVRSGIGIDGSPTEKPLTFLKFSAEGLEQWRTSVESYTANGYYTGISTVKFDRRGNVLVVYVEMGLPDNLLGVVVAGQIGAEGKFHWKRKLPIKWEFPFGQMSRAVLVTADNGLIIAGHYPSGIDWCDKQRNRSLMRLDARGRTVWATGADTVRTSPSLAINRMNRLCLVGLEGTALFAASNGRLQSWDKSLDFVSDVLSADRGFVLCRGQELTKINWMGRKVWGAPAYGSIGVVPDCTGGWILASGRQTQWSPSVARMAIHFVRVAPDGASSWEHGLAEYSFLNDSFFLPKHHALRAAPDGTLRIILNATQGSYYSLTPPGINVLAFATE